LIKSKSYRELGLNKSTLWYQKKRLEEAGSIRIYLQTNAPGHWQLMMDASLT